MRWLWAWRPGVRITSTVPLRQITTSTSEESPEAVAVRRCNAAAQWLYLPHMAQEPRRG